MAMQPLSPGRAELTLIVENTGDRPIRVGIGDELGLKKRLAAVQDCRRVNKGDMVNNGWLPNMEIDTQTYAMRANGHLFAFEPATVPPMTQRYFLF